MDLKSEKILIAGAGISGIGAAALLGKAGIAAAIYDGNEELDKEAVAAKLPEGMEISFELGEFKEEMYKLGKAENEEEKAKDKKHAENELGDLIFSIINAARLYHLNPDTALESTCAKFKRRFTYLEQQTIRKGLDLKQMSLEEMDRYWNEAKAMERE